MCAECADRVDKKENEPKFPVELLRHWKQFHESAIGTDFASLQSRVSYPVRKLTIVDFAGVKGETTIDFGALTLFYGTSKLNWSIGEILEIYSDRNKFEQTRQPISGVSSRIYGSIPVAGDMKLGLTVSTSEPRYFTANGKLKLYLSEGREIVVCASTDDVGIFINDAQLPVFHPFLKLIKVGKNFEKTALHHDCEENSNDIDGISRYFEITAKEVTGCIQGLPSDISVFDYKYRIKDDSELLIKIRTNDEFYPIRVLSSGELKRFVLDMSIRIATYSAKVRPTVLTINQSHISSLDAKGWADFFEWVEKSKPPFQVVVDCCNRPSEGDLSRALCYEVLGTDMDVESFEQRTWASFKQRKQV